MKLLLINEQTGDILKQAIQAYVKVAEDNKNENADGSILLSGDREILEEIVTSVEHASDQPIEELIFSAIDRELGESGAVDILMRKAGDSSLLDAISDDEIKAYYEANLASPPPQSTPPTE